MPLLPHAPLLDETLRSVARRYRMPAIPDTLASASIDSPATALAVVIEQTRAVLARGQAPNGVLRGAFINALADAIHEGMRAQGGDPAIQAMELRHRMPHVREYASLAAHAERDRRLVRATVNAIAHPAKLARTDAGAQRDMLVQLQALASSGAWTELAATAQRFLADPAVSDDPLRAPSLARLLDGAELTRLQRIAALAADGTVQRYQTLWDRHGPRSGSSAAAARGNAAQRRGAAVEDIAAEALHRLADRLNDAEAAPGRYRVVTSMRVPSSIPASPDRAKSEWDAVLLRRVGDAMPVWDVCLLVEVKASADAATTDFPRLLRGLSLLASAAPDAVYTFATRQGDVQLTGASLAALGTDDSDLPREVLYCSNAPADTAPRLLSAASRMQLLSTEASLAFASKVATDRPVDANELEPVWHALLQSPRWTTVLNQYPMLRSVRELMVHVADLATAIEEAPP